MAAFQRRDIAKIVDLFRIKSAEIDRSVEAPSSAEADAEEWKRVLERTVDLKVARDEDLETMSWSDGKLVDVKTKEGGMPLVIRMAEHYLAVPYVVSALGQGLRIVR